MSGLNFDLSTGTISGLRLDYRIDDRHTRFVRGGIDNNKSLSGAVSNPPESLQTTTRIRRPWASPAC
jgi:hypothetical protein